AAQDAENLRHHRIDTAVSHEDGYPGIRLGAFGEQLLLERQIAGQGNDAGQLPGLPQSAAEDHRRALREPREKDALRRNSTLDFARDQGFELEHRFANPDFVLAVGDLHALDVVPGTHAHAAIDRDRAT